MGDPSTTDPTYALDLDRGEYVVRDSSGVELGAYPYELHAREHCEGAGPLGGAEGFFYAHAGFSHAIEESADAGHRRCARDLAEAERWLAGQPSLFVAVEPDPMPWDGDEPYGGPLYVVSIMRDHYPDSYVAELREEGAS